MKSMYILMAALSGLLYTVGDAFYKMKIQDHADVGFFDFFRFWALPGGVILGLAVAYGFGVFGKFLSIYPLKEVDISVYAPMVVVFAVLVSAVVGVLFFDEQISSVRGVGILFALFAIYLLNTSASI